VSVPAPFHVDAATLAPRLGSSAARDEDPGALTAFVRMLVAGRAEFGITRIGCITRLDRIGVPVVQVATPASRSLAVSQGKGATLPAAAVSGLLEAIEVWAAERIPAERCRLAAAASLPGTAALYEECLLPDLATRENWTQAETPWIDGFDLFTGRIAPVPLALVDTLYTVPSPHPAVFPRTTTGLGAGRTLPAAIVQAALEILERDAVANSRARRRFFEQFRISYGTVGIGRMADLLDRIERAGFAAGFWRAPAPHDLPIIICHVVEDGVAELAPLPAAGYACGLSMELALCGALLEACQARLTAISGAREDITRRAFRPADEREELEAWKLFLREPGGCTLGPGGTPDAAPPLERVTAALRRAGAQAAMVVPLYSDDHRGIHVVRAVAPPLRQGDGLGP
jgi:ribosomal protein S12 methylthiotransferase accessory factor